MGVRPAPLPDHALLAGYRAQGSYTDCFVKGVAGTVDLAAFLTAFYSTPLFRLERLILRLVARRPSTDAEVAALASGNVACFAAWTVEQRTTDQIMLCDLTQATRSWFMVTPTASGTRLSFGSAVVHPDHWTMRLALPFHKIYARALLWSASP